MFSLSLVNSSSLSKYIKGLLDEPSTKYKESLFYKN